MIDDSNNNRRDLSDEEIYNAIEAIVFRFEEAWQHQGEADLAAFVPADDHPLRPQALIELIKVDQEFRCGAGQAKGLEEYLLEWAELNDKPHAIKELLEAECQTRAYLSQYVTVEELQRRFPDIADEIDLAKFAHETIGETRPEPRALRVHCPHCNNPVEIIDNLLLKEIACQSCGSSFNLITDEGVTGNSHALPQKIAHFELIEQIGIGTFGTVWRARDTKLDCIRAVKIPRKSHLSKEEQEKFLREPRAAAQLRHPNIVSVHEVGVENNTIYIVSDFIQGLTLDEWMKQCKPTYTEVAELCVKIAESLHHAHKQGVIHRDLKPANIIISPNDEPHLMDFGLAKREAGEITMTIEGQILGTPAYMSPEQAVGSGHDADCRSDVYSLGVILFELLTGEQPFRGNVRMLLKQVIEDDPPIPRKLGSRIPRDLETICLKCLEKLPDRRYPSMQDMADELRRYLRGEPIHARPVTQLEHLWRWCKRKPLVASLTMAFIVAMLVGIMVSTYFAIEANQKAKESLFQKSLAESRLLKSRMAQYVGQISIAQRDISNGDYRHAHYILNRCAEDLRGWEHDYLRTVLQKRMHSLQRHDAEINAVVFSPDDKYVVSGSNDGTVKCWDRSTGCKFFEFKEHNQVYDVAISPDGRYIASGGSSGNDIKIRDILSSEVRSIKYKEHDLIRSLAFSPDGKQIAAGTSVATIFLWDLEDPKTPRKLTGHKASVNSVVFSPDGKRLFSGSSDKTVKVWDIEKQEVIHSLPGHDGVVLDVALSPDGKWIASGSADGTIKVWDASSCDQVTTISGFGNWVRSVAFSRDGKRIMAGGGGFQRLGQIKVWDIDSGLEVLSLTGHTGRVNSVAFSFDGKHIVSGGEIKTVKIWDLFTGESPFTHQGCKGPVYSVAFDAKGERVIFGGRDSTAKVWDTESDEVVQSMVGHDDSILSITVSPSGDRIATGSWDAKVIVWDADAHQAIRTFSAHHGGVCSVAFDRSERLVVSGSWDGKVKVWNIVESKEIRSFKGHEGRVNSVAFTPDGKWVVSASSDKSLKVWDVAKDKEIRTLKGHCGGVCSVSISPNGRWIASGSEDKTIKIWDITTGKEVDSLDGHQAWVNSIAFSPNGKYLVSGGGNYKTSDGVKVWNVELGVETLSFAGNLGAVNSVAFSSDGRRIVSGWDNGMIKVWEVAKMLRENPGMTEISSNSSGNEEQDPLEQLPVELLPLMEVAHHNGGAVAHDKKIYVWTGYTNSKENRTAALEIYDPIANSWSRGANMPAKRNGNGYFILNGMIYSIGGEKNSYTGSSEFWFSNKVFRYDPATNKWDALNDLPHRAWDPMMVVCNGKAYLIGGRRGYGPTYRDVYEYDASNDSWVAKEPMPISVMACGVASHDGKIYIFGGEHRESEAKSEFTSTIQVYDPTSNNWTIMGEMPWKLGRSHAVAGKDSLYLFADVIYNAETKKPEHNECVYRWTPSTKKWARYAFDAPVPSYMNGPVVMMGGFAYIMGTNDSDQSRLPQAFRVALPIAHGSVDPSRSNDSGVSMEAPCDDSR